MSAIMAEQTPESRMGEMNALFANMEEFHLNEPHWYLPLIGVDPARQGQRLGDKLMVHALARCDAERTGAYLESVASFYDLFHLEPAGDLRLLTYYRNEHPHDVRARVLLGHTYMQRGWFSHRSTRYSRKSPGRADQSACTAHRKRSSTGSAASSSSWCTGPAAR